ncbi:MAG: c-type cytochrome [Hylemonella sp.]|uniref:c-type cytochrome n=1 Tax=Hylemonella sp. TaxID=2066020 RepID=UPI0022C2EFA4|nr:c-type cytochrome [Hylemonella sp.]MCZ8252833.1 c-type cytochrome [Hylemonella sp.]
MTRKAKLLCALLLSPALLLAQGAPALKSGEQVYRETCVVCHGPGLANAPRPGDRQVWGKLMAEGQAVLTAHGWVGVRAMPPKGGRNDLSLEEFARAVAWMARESGGNWQDPDARLLERIRAEEGKRLEQLRKSGKG